MGRRSRNKPKPAAQLPTPPVPAPAPPPAQADTDNRQNSRINAAGLVALLSLVVSVASAYYSYSSAEAARRSAAEAAEANRIALAAQDRAAGKVEARFEFVDQKRDPSLDKPFTRKKDGFDQQVFRIESVDELLLWSPQVHIRNTGTETIDALKVEIGYLTGGAYGVGVRQIDPPPVVYNDAVSHEVTGFGKLMPGQTARIGVAPLLLAQISRLKWDDYADKDHIGVLTAHVYGRLVGATSYDRNEDRQPVVFTFHWRPAGFKPDAKGVKDALDLKPWVRIE